MSDSTSRQCPATRRFITEGRIEVYSLAIIAFYAVFLIAGEVAGAWFETRSGQALLSNFLPLWCAARLAIQGSAASAYDWAALRACEITATGQEMAVLPWVQPPAFLFLVTPLGLLAYRWAFVVWETASLCGYLCAIYAILPRRPALLAAIATPTTLWNLMSTQNGFLFAGVLGGALVSLERWPMVSGIFLTLLTGKPHLGLLFPVALMLGGYWRAFAWAALGTTTLIAASCIAFGGSVWVSFLASLPAIADYDLVNTHLSWTNITTSFGFLQWFGMGDTAASIGFLIVAGSAALLVWWTWRSTAAFSLKATALSAGAMMATPYLLIYDMTIAPVAAAFLVRHGLITHITPTERTVLLLSATMFAYPALGAGAPPIACVVPALLLALSVTRALSERAQRN